MTSFAPTVASVRVVAPIAGIAFEHRVEGDIPIETPDTDVWQGGGVSAMPVVIDHVLGSCDVSELRHVMDAPPWSAYYVDDAGQGATLLHQIVDAIPARLVLSRAAGERYEVRYARRPTVPVDQRDVELAIFTFALAARQAGVLAHG